MLKALFSILVFPGVMFLAVFGFIAEFYDRKLYARLQNRVGPPWFQPWADFIKLVGKESLIPEEANPGVFKFMPVLALTSVASAFLYIPLWRQEALFSFNGDIIVVVYLLTIPTLTLFLGGWYSRSIYSTLGAMRSLTQLFAYEIPLLASILAAALLANTWSLGEITVFYSRHPWLWLINLPGFIIAIITLLGKLQKVPFDIPEAETEIVAGTLTEYSGKFLGLFRLMTDAEMVVCAALLSAVFLPFGLNLTAPAGFVLFLLKIFAIISVLSLLRTVFARMRLDQMINFCWKFLAPCAMAQVLVDLIVKGVIAR
ncbi:MAG: complex I subunit 1 family protein [Candidatus Omnitrophota bacterium]